MLNRLIRLAPLFLSLGAAAPPDAAVTLYRGAMVWTGTGFAPRTLAVRDGRFVDAAGARGTIVELGGRFIVPAYANAHCHLVSPTRESSDAFLRAGVFYVWNPNSIVLSTGDRAFFGRADTIDAKIAMGGITEPRGHPEPLYVDTLSRFVYTGHDRSWFVGNAFHYGRTPAEIDAALDRLVAQHADFVKAYLLYSEEWAKRRDDPAFEGWRGLNPANMPYLVTAAHRRQLKVAVHVETAADLTTAARAGVDYAEHLPAYGSSDAAGRTRLTPAQARLVARTGMPLVPTYGVGAAAIEDARAHGKPMADAERLIADQRINLRLLKAAGGRFWMGTDGRGPIYDEAEHWVRLGAFSAAEATRIVLGTGAQLFPERRVGCLQAGCEADFLVLRGNPTRDIAQLRSIERRVKGGRTLALPPPPVDG